ncbi:MAG: ferric reductase-like transmembrane domain-containing protein [Ilumatobacteraceae bacterium]
MDQWWWYLTRASGIVATVLAVGSLVFGAFFSARNTGNRKTPAWWLDLHNYLGGLALVFTGVHLLASALDPNSGIGIVQVLIPGTAASATWAVTWGVLATYTFVIAVFTSWPRRRFSRKVWRWLHLTSVAGVALAGLHGFQLGSDATKLLFEVGLGAAAALTVYAIVLRAIGAVSRSMSS